MLDPLLLYGACRSRPLFAPNVLGPVSKAVVPAAHMASALPTAAICPITFAVFLNTERETGGEGEHLVARKTTHASHMSTVRLCIKVDQDETKTNRLIN